MSEAPKQEFIPAQNYMDPDAKEDLERVYRDEQEYSSEAQEAKALTNLAESGNGVSRIRVPRELKRQKVVHAFQDAFELIGGVPRLAHWADENPDKFYQLYARLLPVEASQKVTHDGEVVIKHVIPPGPLDK